MGIKKNCLKKIKESLKYSDKALCIQNFSVIKYMWAITISLYTLYMLMPKSGNETCHIQCHTASNSFFFF